MTDKREVKFRLGWFNIFNLGGAAYGWHLTHNWEGAFWGFAGGTLLPIGFILSLFLCICVLHVAGKIGNAITAPRYRVAEIAEETQEERWNREYAEHCSAHGLPNELGTIQRQEAYYAEAVEHSRSTGYTSSGGPG